MSGPQHRSVQTGAKDQYSTVDEITQHAHDACATREALYLQFFASTTHSIFTKQTDIKILVPNEVLYRVYFSPLDPDEN